jgi:hypothetical protein
LPCASIDDVSNGRNEAFSDLLTGKCKRKTIHVLLDGKPSIVNTRYTSQNVYLSNEARLLTDIRKQGFHNLLNGLMYLDNRQSGRNILSLKKVSTIYLLIKMNKRYQVCYGAQWLASAYHPRTMLFSKSLDQYNKLAYHPEKHCLESHQTV